MHRTKDKLYKIIFEADTRGGKTFDLILIIFILASVGLVLADSMESVNKVYASELKFAELIITGLFTAEYLLRIYIVDKPSRYIFSFYGIIDLLAIIPGFLIFILAGAQSLMIIRAVRLIRVFRVLKLTRYTSAGRMLGIAMYRSREKIFMFLAVILTMVLIFGTVMYMVEGHENGFTSIPVSIYWAIVTLTTVGYGDISPATGAGQIIASLLMIMGYAIIAVPTGIVTSEMINMPRKYNTQVCSKCLYDIHDDDALYCKKCGNSLNTEDHS
ncbi:MAG: ion transporter [Bacteroidales bacterium]|nr:ion transporter [Bacteroidales bacterium]